MNSILNPDKNSIENIKAFITTIEDDDLKKFFLSLLNDILIIGENQKDNAAREKVFTEIQKVITSRITGDKNENREN